MATKFFSATGEESATKRDHLIEGRSWQSLQENDLLSKQEDFFAKENFSEDFAYVYFRHLSNHARFKSIMFIAEETHWDFVHFFKTNAHVLALIMIKVVVIIIIVVVVVVVVVVSKQIFVYS